MTEAELKEFLEANKADIQQAVKQRMIDSLLTQHRWTILTDRGAQMTGAARSTQQRG